MDPLLSAALLPELRVTMATDLLLDEPAAKMEDTDNSTIIRFTHAGKPYSCVMDPDANISELSRQIAELLSIPESNQKFLVPKLGLLKYPFDAPISVLIDKKITLLGSTAAQASSVATAAHEASRYVAKSRPVQQVKAYKTHDWKREQEEALYTFTTLRPLEYLPNPGKSLKFLQRLKDDAGIKASMRKHKFTVPLLTEMNPIEHTQSNHEGTTRTLGLNRNAGEVIELRLRTDAYDGYRDYKTIRKTLCHELAHNVHGPHDKNFWALCRQIEKEVEGADWKSGGHTTGTSEEYYGSGEDVDDHGGWTGGEYTLGTSYPPGTTGEGIQGSSTGKQTGLSRREVLARAAEERVKKAKDAKGEGSESGAQ